MLRLFIVCWAIGWAAFVPTDAEAAIYGEQRIAQWWDGFKQDVTETWDHPQSYDLYLPFLTWHNRFTYDKEKTDRYNERPWGGGFGVSRYNADGNWSSLYAMAFKDSHNKWEPIIGYGWERAGIWTKTVIFVWGLV
jgi:palmitoyl transferase